jgi:hypothetical protein
MNLSEKAVIDRIESYAAKFLLDNNRNTPVTDEVLEKTYKHCVIPASKELYSGIKIRIEEMRNDSRYSFYDDEQLI